MVNCRKCGQGPMETANRGAYLNRVNEKGVEGIWECAPSCEHKHGNQEDALIAALDANNDPTKCPHGLHWMACKNKECIEEVYRAEDAATCPHGFLVGCPTCAAELE